MRTDSIVESARVARAGKMIDSLIHYYSGGGAAVVSQKNLVEYLVEWPPKIEKNITPVMVLLQVAL